MELRHIRYFVAAVEEGSLQGAAHRLHIAQPALSRRIRDLEASLGCDLLVRGTRGVTPTRAGASFYRDALVLLGRLDEARNCARLLGREEDGVARVGLMPTARKYAFLSEALTTFAAGDDEIPITYSRASSADLARGLREGSLDVALLYERRMAAPLIGERLIHQECYVLALHPGNPLATMPSLSFADLAGQPLIWLSRQDDADHHDLLMQQCRLHGLDPLIAHSAHSHEEQLDIAAVSGGAFLTPASTTLSTPPGTLVFRALPDLAMSISLTLAWRGAVEAGPSAALLRALHAAIDRHQSRPPGTSDWTFIEGHRVVILPEPVAAKQRNDEK